MKRWQKYGFATLAAILSVTGVAEFWMKYVLQTDDPFAVVNHPLQPWMLDGHILAAPAFLVVFGIVFASHIDGRLGRRIPNRGSGVVALAMVALMTGSGYALQAVTGERARQVLLIVHLVSGAVFAVAYAVHLVVSRRLWRAQRVFERRVTP